MKIAVVTDDGKTICDHFGRARLFAVCSVENGEIVSRDLRDKAGHHQFVHESHSGDSEHHEDHSQGHGMGAGAAARHTVMLSAITDCEVLITRGMGRGAYLALKEADITPIVTDEGTVDAAVHAYVRGDIEDHIERLH